MGTEPQTVDDSKVNQLANALEELSELRDAPPLDESDVQFGDEDELRIEARGEPDGSLNTEYRDSDIERLRGTAFYEHIQRIVRWSYQAGAEHVVVDGSFIADDSPEYHAVSIKVFPFEHFRLGPYDLRFRYTGAGTMFMELSMNPLHEVDSSQHIHGGGLEKISVRDVQKRLREEMPYIGSRVHELVERCGAKESHARATALREIGLSHKEISQRLGVSEGASQSYVSKMNRAVEQSFALSLARSEQPKRVLASTTIPAEAPGHTKTMYICRAIGVEDTTVWLITKDEFVKDFVDEDNSGKVTVSCEKYPSLQHLVDAQAPDHQTVTEKWKRLLEDIDDAYIRGHTQKIDAPEPRY